MGKTFVICEVVKVPFGEGYRPVVRPEGDPTWIDRRHVIDEPGLHQRIWAVCDYEKGDIDVAVQTLLDPPKAEEAMSHPFLWEPSLTHSIPAQAIYAAHTHLEDAESELGYFIREVVPQTDEGENALARMKDARKELKKFIKKWEADFYAITEDLPEGEE